jgi:hypothetical protein
VSATVVNVVEMVRACVPVLVDVGCQFKVARELQQVEWLTHPSCPRENAGKILTAYPSDDAQAVRLARSLDAATADLTGPRVLSDRCLRPGGVVHYRYGAFTGVPYVNHDGEMSSALVTPDGIVELDSRAAGRVAPAWADDPFVAAPPSPSTGGVLLDGRYAVREAIRHANKGGVFRATDRTTQRAVVVKQARAHVGTDAHGRDARDRLRGEAAALVALAHTGAMPELVGTFEQDGDLFAVEEDLGGQSFRSWVTSGMEDGIVRRSWAETGRVVCNLARHVAAVHEAGAVIRDLSPNNVIVTGESTKLIDLEFAALHDSETPIRSGTPGYAAPEQFDGATPTASADSSSLGAMLLFAFTGEDPFLGFGVTTTQAWLARGMRTHLVPKHIAELAVALRAPEPSARPTAADAARVLAAPLLDVAPLRRERAIAATLADVRPIADTELDDAIDALIARLLADIRPERGQVARRSAFGERTLSANVQHGAAGILGVLVQAHTARPSDALAQCIEDVANWLEQRLANRCPGPVGLYFGWAGPCWALGEAGVALGDRGRVQRAAEHALSLPRDWPGPDVTHGLAGLGLTLVQLWQRTGDPRLSAAVDQIARRLVEHADYDNGAVSWTTPRGVASSFAGSRFYGFAHGVAGIGAFLDHATLTTGRDEYAAVAATAAATLRRVAVDTDGITRWGSGPDETGAALAHWCNGSSGVVTFLARRPTASDDRELIDRAARACVAAKWHSGIAYCHGLSGNADLLLDLDGGPYREWAADLLRVMWQRHTTDAFGPALTDEVGRVTPDFNVGYGGALSALLRLRHGGSRLWLPELTP